MRQIAGLDIWTALDTMSETLIRMLIVSSIWLSGYVNCNKNLITSHYVMIPPWRQTFCQNRVDRPISAKSERFIKSQTNKEAG